MKIYHYLKDRKKSPHEIILAVPEAFNKSEQYKGVVSDKGWLLKGEVVENFDNKKYNDNAFAILFEPEEIEHLFNLFTTLRPELLNDFIEINRNSKKIDIDI